jgi:hypothetical protein
MAGRKKGAGPKPVSHGAFGSEPPAEKGALRRYKDRDQLRPQGSDPADKRPTDPDSIEHANLPARDTQYGSDDN